MEKSEAPVYDEVKDMVYTHAALCESMRLYPPVPLDTKETMNDDVLPSGTVVKKGMFVTYHVYAMGRMESIWGEDRAGDDAGDGAVPVVSRCDGADDRLISMNSALRAGREAVLRL